MTLERLIAQLEGPVEGYWSATVLTAQDIFVHAVEGARHSCQILRVPATQCHALTAELAAFLNITQKLLGNSNGMPRYP